MPMRIRSMLVVAALVLMAGVPVQLSGAGQEAAALLAEGLKLLRAGDRFEAQARFERAVKADVKSYDAHYALGRVLDLNGEYEAARRHFEEALALAPEAGKDQPLTAIAVSYAFDGQPDEAAKYYQRIFDRQTASKDPEAGATANAIARVYLEAGDVAKAERWYRTGRETARAMPELKPEQADLLEFRWFHAQARLAARRGDAASASSYMKQAKQVLDKGTNDDQGIQWPYLAGYVAFHTGDYTSAVRELERADQDDPFILGLIAQAYDRMGKKDRAREYFEAVLDTPAHTINAAYSWPMAKKYLGVR